MPDPVPPTIATVLPAGMTADTPSSTTLPEPCGCSPEAAYVKVRFLNSMSPRTAETDDTAVVASASVIAGTASMTSSIRAHDAIPRCSRLVTHPNAIIGHESISRYALNATSSPTVMRPAMTSRLPSHNTSSTPMPISSWTLG